MDWINAATLSTLRLVERWDARRRGKAHGRGLRPRALAPGAVVAGRYRLDAVLGEGGMGRVWLAEDQLEHRQVALKQMRAVARGPGPVAREGSEAVDAGLDVAFKREFYTMTKLQHPNTIQVFDYGLLETGERYLTMEVVRGKDLATALKSGPFEMSRLYRVLIEMAKVLGFIHSRLYVHCDVKSENISVTERGGIKLMDFGLMHQLGTPAGGVLKGTPHYMAPEVPRGGVIDARTDLYSLGVLAFELATGRFPFQGKTMMELISAHLNQPPPRLQPLRKVPPELEALVLKLLAKEPKDRFQSTSELLAHLSAICGQSVAEEGYVGRTSYLHCADLVGRDEEQRALKLILDRLLEGDGKSIFVTAPAGIGKTRLLQEFRLAVKIADVPFLVGQCRAEGQAPMAPLIEALSQLIPFAPQEANEKFGPILARLIPRLASVLTHPPRMDQPLPDKVVLFEALRGWLSAIAERQTFMLCLEDLHWADATTLEFMNIVIRHLAGTRGMVLGTFRSNEVDRLSVLFQTVDDNITQRLELAPLTRQYTATLIEAMLNGLEVPTEFVQRLYDVTQGNAFFVTETMRAFIEQGTLQLENGRWITNKPADQIDIAPTIEKVVLTRLATLDESTLSFCRRVAPLGRLLELNVMKEVTAVQEAALFETLDRLMERQFIQKVDENYYFSHDTVRYAIYDSTPPEEKRRAHQGIAVALERVHAAALDAQAALLGYHYARGEDRQKAIGYLLRASEQTRANNLMLRTTELMAQAADLIESGEYPNRENTLLGVWARIVEVATTAHPTLCVKYADKLFEAWAKRIDLERAKESFHAEYQRLLTRPRWLARRKLARIWSDEPLSPLSKDSAHIIPRLFTYRALQGLGLASIGQNARVLEVSERQAKDNPYPGPFRSSAFTCRAIQLLHTGQFQHLGEGARQAKEGYDLHIAQVGLLPKQLWKDLTWIHHFIVLEQAMTGKPLDLDIWKAGLELCEKHQFGDLKWFLNASVGVHAALAGDPVEMQKTYDLLVDLMRRMGNPQMAESRLSIWVGLFWIQRLEREVAEAVVGRVEFWFGKLPHDAWMKRYALTFRALFEATFGQKEKALKMVEDALASASDVPSFRLKAQLLCAKSRLLVRSERAEAKAVAEQAWRIATTQPTATPWDEMVALRTLAEALEGPAAVEHAERSIAVAREWKQGFHEGLAQFTLARAALKLDRARAGAALEEAERLLKEYKAEQWLQRLEQFRLRAASAESPAVA